MCCRPKSAGPWHCTQWCCSARRAPAAAFSGAVLCDGAAGFCLAKYAELVHVRVREAGGHRRHLRVLAVALAEHEELHRDELGRLSGERGHGGGGWIFPRAAPGGPNLCPCRGPFGGGRGGE